MAYFKDLREFMAEVQRRGRLYTFTVTGKSSLGTVGR